MPPRKKVRRKPVDGESPATTSTDAAAENKGTLQPEEVVAEDTLPVLRVMLPASSGDPSAAGSLAGLRLVVSEGISIEGLPTTHGVLFAAMTPDVPAAADGEAADASNPAVPAAVAGADFSVATSTAAEAKLMLAAGAVLVGKSSEQPLTMDGGDLLGANFGNPAIKLRVAGGGCTGMPCHI